MIALVAIAAEFRKVEDIFYPPLGLLYVGGALKKAGYEVKIYHIFAKEIDKTVEEIAKTRPEWVGFSVFTGLPCQRAAVMSQKIKELDKTIPIVWGGVHPSIAPETTLAEPYIDYIVIGEGEVTAVALSDALKSGGGVEGVLGIGFKKDGKIVVNGSRPHIKNLDEYKIDWSLADPRRYLRPMGNGRLGIVYVSSRGCPYSCTFCYNKKFHKQHWRAHSVDFVVNDISKLKEKYGINALTFSEDEVFIDEKRAFEMLRRLQEIGVQCTWLNLRFEHVTAENIRRLTELKVETILLGWESGSDRLLRLINKKLDKKFILEKCRVLAGFKDVHVDAAAIIGLPTQTWSEVEETIDLALEMSDILPSVTLLLGTYLPYPGTELYELAVRDGFRPPQNTEGWGKFDQADGDFELNWLPWATGDHRRIFYLIDKYVKYLDRARCLSGKNPFLKTLAKRVLYAIARWRLKRRFFAFPADVWLEQWWTRRLISKNLYGSGKMLKTEDA